MKKLGEPVSYTHLDVYKRQHTHTIDTYTDSIIEEAKLVGKEPIKVSPESPKRWKKSTDQSNCDFSVNKYQENKLKTSVMYPVLDFIMGDIKTRFTAVSSIHDYLHLY